MACMIEASVYLSAPTLFPTNIQIMDFLWQFFLFFFQDHSTESIQHITASLANLARTHSFDPNFLSPFAEQARSEGINIVGGKPDDITVLIAVVSEMGEEDLDTWEQERWAHRSYRGLSFHSNPMLWSVWASSLRSGPELDASVIHTYIHVLV